LKAFKQQVESRNVELPGHEAPPQDGAGLLQVRVFVRVTLPQVPDHGPSVHADQPPATADHEGEHNDTTRHGRQVTASRIGARLTAAVGALVRGAARTARTAARRRGVGTGAQPRARTAGPVESAPGRLWQSEQGMPLTKPCQSAMCTHKRAPRRRGNSRTKTCLYFRAHDDAPSCQRRR
jgi:hypothetical protein